MHFARTEEQDELAAIVRAMLDKRSDSGAVRAAIGSDAGYHESLWQAMCDQVGVAALPVPEDQDGFGASLVETAIVLEELGRSLAPSPLLGTAIATAAVLAHADATVRDDLLPAVCAGGTATLVLDDLVLDPRAGLVLRVSGDALERVDEPATAPTGSLDQTLRLGRVAGAGTRIGDVPHVEALHHVAWALTSAVQVGTAQRGLDMTVAYSKERVQFGRPIGSFQALKHRMADLLVLVEASRSASWAATTAAAAYVQDPGEQTAAALRRYALVARSYCSDALDAVASETVQLHGGIAITWEHDAQLVLKRAHALSRLWEPAHRARAEVLTRD